MRLVIPGLVFLLFACNDPVSQVQMATVTTTSSTTTTTIYKDLFSQWDQNGSPGLRLIFTGWVYGMAYYGMAQFIDLGIVCNCNFAVNSPPTSNVNIYNCSGPTPQCVDVQKVYLWSNANGTLTLCESAAPSTCTSFH